MNDAWLIAGPLIYFALGLLAAKIFGVLRKRRAVRNRLELEGMKQPRAQILKRV